MEKQLARISWSLPRRAHLKWANLTSHNKPLRSLAYAQQTALVLVSRISRVHSLMWIIVIVRDIMCCTIQGWLHTGITPRWFFNREFSLGQPSLIHGCGSRPQCCGAMARYDKEQRAARLVHTRKRAELEAAWQSVSWQLLPNHSALSNAGWGKHCSPFCLLAFSLSFALSLCLYVR